MKKEKESQYGDHGKQEFPFDYSDSIIYWELKEGVWYTPEMVEEQLALYRRHIGATLHGLLVNATYNAVIHLDSLEQLISYQTPFRNAIAIVTGENLATYLIFKFYISTLNVLRPVKLFKSHEQARAWLKEQNLEANKRK